MIQRWALATAIGVGVWSAACGGAADQAASGEIRSPNIVVVFADDLGYGDLPSYGHPTIQTPNLDGLAADGQRWTSFYVAASVCSPSRAGLLTGRLPIRTGMYGTLPSTRVLFPDSTGGLPESEITIAEALRARGYATGVIGKWHLGHLPEYLPARHGFDYWYGLPYSNDMDRTVDLPGFEDPKYYEPRSEYWNVPLMRNGETLERPAQQETLTRRYTEEAVAFIETNADRPFFLYVPHTMVHIPLFRDEAFVGHSRAGRYGDALEEIDWSVGRIVETLEARGLANDTLVVFTSDNGPWLPFREHGGSAGPLRMGKGTTWDGGVRVPAIVSWPGHIRPGVVMDLGSTLDLFPTFVRLAGGGLPEDRIIDGVDLTPTLLDGAPSPRQVMPFYRYGELYAFRKGRYKAHFITQGEYGQGTEREEHAQPLLFDLDVDPGEQFDIAGSHPEVVADLIAEVDRHRATVERAPSQFDTRAGAATQP